MSATSKMPPKIDRIDKVARELGSRATEAPAGVKLANGGSSGGGGTGGGAGETGVSEPPARPRLPPTIRAGMGDVATEAIEIYSDEAYGMATGLVAVLERDGSSTASTRAPVVGAHVWRDILRGMLRLRSVDRHLAKLSAEGRLGAYAPADGREAALIAAAAALGPDDWIVPGPEHGGINLHRGMSIRAYLAQAFGNADDVAKGRREPGQTAGLRSTHVLPAGATSATKLPQAAGLAWAAKIKGEKIVVIAYLDQGATSAEDFHTGMNFAAVFKVPVVFMCVNRGEPGAHADGSLSRRDHAGSVTYAVKALAYGIPGIRVDGADPLAVYEVARAAIDRARGGGGPTFIEAATAPAHDSTGGGDGESKRAPRRDDAFERYARWLRDSGNVSENDQEQLASEIESEVTEAIAEASGVGLPSLETLIEDVYRSPPATLSEQLGALKRVRGAKLRR